MTEAHAPNRDGAGPAAGATSGGGWWLNLPIRWKGLLIVLLPLATLVVLVAVRAPLTARQDELVRELARDAETRAALQDLLLALLDAETGARGYALTRDAAYLDPLEDARRDVPASLDAVRRFLTAPEDAAALNRLEALSRERLALANAMAGLAADGAPGTGALLAARLAEGRATMAEARLLVETLVARHAQTLAADRAALESLQQRVGWTMLASFVVGFGGAVVAAWLFARGIASRVTELRGNAGRLALGMPLEGRLARGRDELGELHEALRRAAHLLRRRETELRELNESLHAALHEQTVLNREIESFSYSVSHDLRAPLRSIDGFAQAIVEDCGDRLDDTGRGHLARVRAAAQRMGLLIDDLLRLSRVTRASVERQPVDLSVMAREIAAELSAREPARAVAWDIAEGLTVSCDAALARVALENLLSNAWKFTGKNGEAQVTFAAMPETHPATFVVRDNGVGFDMAYIDKLFGAFQRLHGDREFPGTGVGLATVQRVVRKHGGHIRAHAEVGRGAAFYFTLEPDDAPAPEQSR